MPFTNIELIRKHLSESTAVREFYRDVPVELSGTSPMALVHSQLKEGSVVIKGKEIGSPKATIVTLDSLPAFLGTQNIIPESVVVASDTSLGFIYTEHVDYHVDYVAGTIERVDSGAIPDNANVAVWFYAYRLYQPSADYAVDHQRGTVRRLSGGNIEDGQTVFIDYETQSSLLDEDQINNAINEANDLLMNLIDTQYRESSEQSLVTAETYLAMSVLCRIKSLQALQQPSGATAAKSWQEMGIHYEVDALKLLTRFAAKPGQLNTPVSVVGGDA